jgi:hypothetical protein
MKAITIEAIATVIERHKLEAVNGEYQLTAEMLAEAEAIDEAHGTRPSPEKLAELKAATEGKAPGWEEVGEEETIADYKPTKFDN